MKYILLKLKSGWSSLTILPYLLLIWLHRGRISSYNLQRGKIEICAINILLFSRKDSSLSLTVMWIVIHTSTSDYLLQLRKEHDKKCWGIFRWRNRSQTQTQDNFTCLANKACSFLTLAFYGQNLSVYYITPISCVTHCIWGRVLVVAFYWELFGL